MFLRVWFTRFIYESEVEKVNDENKFLLLSERAQVKMKDILPTSKQIDLLAEFFQNLSDSTRLKIISCLSVCDLCVNDICALLSLNQTTVSHQLQILKAQNLVSYRREGKILIYSLESPQINDVLSYASDSF